MTWIIGALILGFLLGWVGRTWLALRDKDCFNRDHKNHIDV